MPPPLTVSKRRKPIITYGRSSRSKISSFKVFQDALDEEQGVDKGTKRELVIISKGHDYVSHSPRSSPPTIGLQALDPVFEDANDPISEEDPFADPGSPLSLRFKPLIPPKRRNKGTSTNTNASSQSERGKRNQFEKQALTDKSTNHLILIKSATTTGEVRDSITLLPQRPKREACLSPRLRSKKKTRLDPQVTPQLILKAEPPLRPRKHRQAGSFLENQDFLTMLSSSKARKPDCKSRFRRYSGIFENGPPSPYNEPPILLGTSGVEVSGGTDITWAREKAKEILNGTKRAAGKILRVSTSRSGYKNRQQKAENTKGRRGISKNVGIAQEAQERGPEDESILNFATVEVESSDKDVVGLQNFLEDPLSSPEDYEFGQSTGSEVDENWSLKPSHTPDPNRAVPYKLQRTESTQNLLVLGSMEVRYPRKAIIMKQPNPKSRNREEEEEEEGKGIVKTWDNFGPFFAATDTCPGTTHRLQNPRSDNEMPSSSPIAKSTPKKDWYRYKGPEIAETLKLKPINRGRGKRQHPAKTVIIALGSSDTDHIERTPIKNSLNNEYGNDYDENSWDEGNEGDKEGAKILTNFNRNKAQRSLDYRDRVTMEPEEKNHLFLCAESEDEIHSHLSDMEISEKADSENGENCYPLDMDIDKASDNEQDRKVLKIVMVAGADIRYPQKEVSLKQKRNDEIRISSSRICKPIPNDNKNKVTDRAGGFTVNRNGGGGNYTTLSRSFSTSIIAGGAYQSVGKKDTKTRKFTLAHDRMETGSDVDELQMNLPSARI